MQMEMFTRVSGLTIKLMAKECINIWMERNMRETGIKTNNMVMELKYGQMEPVMKVNMNMARSTGKERSIGVTSQLMLVNSIITISMARVFIPGAMAENMKEIGKLVNQ